MATSCSSEPGIARGFRGNLDFSALRSGQRVGLIRRSGAGTSTIADLLSGFVFPLAAPLRSAARSSLGTSRSAHGGSEARAAVATSAAMRVVQRAKRSPLLCAILLILALWLANGGSDGLCVMGTILAASIISSTAGFAFSGLCGAALFHLAPSPARAVEIMLICSVANQAMMTWSLRHEIVWRTVARYASGGLIGVLSGIAIVRTMGASTYVLLAGCFLICYGAYTLFARPPRLPDLPPAFDTVIGLLSGFFGGILAFPSVLVVIWTGCKGIDRQTQRAIYQPFILLMQIVAIAALMVMGRVHPGSSHFAVTDLLYMPVALLGTSIGLRLFGSATERQFKAVVSAMLIVSGTALLF